LTHQWPIKKNKKIPSQRHILEYAELDGEERSSEKKIYEYEFQTENFLKDKPEMTYITGKTLLTLSTMTLQNLPYLSIIQHSLTCCFHKTISVILCVRKQLMCCQIKVTIFLFFIGREHVEECREI